MSGVDAFPTLDELQAFCREIADAHPDRVRMIEIGRSRQDEPIHLLSIGRSAAQGSALIIGQPHPNEPIGMVTIMTLCRRLLAGDPAVAGADVSWHFVPCADPDGTRLNEGWFRGPFTREHYARHFYRPGSEEQVEWTFPLEVRTSSGLDFRVARPMPETRALMKAIELTRPTVVSSLHNSELGGAYFYATPGVPALYPRLGALCTDEAIPLHLGEPEFPLSEVLAPAVYSVPTGAQLCELAVASGIDLSALVTGGSSLDFARSCGLDPVAVVVELPYWRDDRSADTSPHPSGVSRFDAIKVVAEDERTSMDRLRGLMTRASPLPVSPFADAVRSFVDLYDSGYGDQRLKQAEADPSFERPASVAEVFTGRDELHSTRLRLLGMLRRALPGDSPLQAEVEELLKQWAQESSADSRSEVIPIDRLVAVQVGSILAAVDVAHPRRPT